MDFSKTCELSTAKNFDERKLILSHLNLFFFATLPTRKVCPVKWFCPWETATSETFLMEYFSPQKLILLQKRKLYADELKPYFIRTNLSPSRKLLRRVENLFYPRRIYSLWNFLPTSWKLILLQTNFFLGTFCRPKYFNPHEFILHWKLSWRENFLTKYICRGLVSPSELYCERKLLSKLFRRGIIFFWQAEKSLSWPILNFQKLQLRKKFDEKLQLCTNF